MDSKKKAGLVRRRKMAKGGLIRQIGKRKYFDAGGTILGGPTSSGTVQNATNPNSGLLGTIGGALGLNDNFVAQSANIQPGTTPGQLNNAYTSAQKGLSDQGMLVQTLAPAVNTAVQNQNDVAAQEKAIMSGSGPNPALTQLNQTTGENVANQAALMAGQRGASANPGLIAREAAQTGAGIQQQAVGQGATLSAEQQIAAANNLANLSNNQVSQAGQAITGENSANQNEESILQNANTSFNNANVGMQSNINNVNAQTAAANQNMNANIFGGVMSAASSGGGVLSSLFAKGGRVGGKEDHLVLAEMLAHSLHHCRKLSGIVKNYDEGGEISAGAVDDAPNLGKFSAGDDAASAPNVAATSTLPADQTDFGKDIAQASGGGGKGGGGGGGLGSLAMLALAGGGEVPKPELTAPPIAGPGPNWAAGYFNAGSPSSGPSIGPTASLPGNKVDLGKEIQKQPKKKPDQPAASGDPSGTPGFNVDPDATTTAMGGASSDGMYGGGGWKEGGSGYSPYHDPNNTQYSAPMDTSTPLAKGGNVCAGPHRSHVANFLAKGGPVAAMVSEGEIYLSPTAVERVVREGADPMKVGMKIKAPKKSEKARVKGDSLDNDKIPMDLEEGGVVIPRHITQAKKMSPEKMELFVHRALMRKKAS